jgi:hypothetical protein
LGGIVTAQIWVAIIAASASLVVAAFSTTKANKAQRDITELTSRLQEQRAERDARRDYEYEARKRLYTQCEPVIFEAMELAENFRHRVVSIARCSRMGWLRPDGTGWLAPSEDDYYIESTAFFLLAPATSFKLIQRRLTAIDLALEPRVHFQYQLLKLAFLSYTWDYELAERVPSLNYHPDDADPGAPNSEQLLVQAPRVYRRQGLYVGIVNQLADALVSDATDSRCKSLGEFCAELKDRESRLGQLSGEISGLIYGFHPESQPILWRTFVVQYLLFGIILRTQSNRFDADSDWSQIFPDQNQADADRLDWRVADQAGSVDIQQPFVIGRDYLLEKLNNLRNMTG